jgi:cell shape-determining protein MreC
MRIDKNGNVGIGTTSPATKFHVVGDGTMTGNLTVSGTINAKYQDVAEWVQSSQALAAGTVVVLDHTKSNQVIASSQAYDTRVAGVISATPGIALGEDGQGKVLVATTGRVKVRVNATQASIQVGDLLVTSDTEGRAMKSMPINIGGVQIHRPGTLVGKALEPLAKGEGEILVLLSLQ